MIENATHVTIFWNLARNPEKNHEKFAEKNAKFEFFAIELMKFINSIAFFLAIFDDKNEIRERCKGVHCVDLRESFPTSTYYLLAKFGFDTAKNEPYYFEISSSREFEFELRSF